LSEKGSNQDLVFYKVINWSKLNQDDFNNYKARSGEIIESKKITKTVSNSFKNYIEAAKQFKFIDEQFDQLYPSRTGSVLRLISENNDASVNNSYELTIYEKIFFLHSLFKKDADYLLTVYYLLRKFPNRELGFYLNKFQDSYRKRLEYKMSVVETNQKDLVKDALLLVNNWRSPKRYSEDIVPPRINWMIDLNLVNDKGNQIVEKFNDVIDNFDQENLSDDLVLKNYFHISSQLYFNHHEMIEWKELNETRKEKSIAPILNIAVKNFSPLKMPRISVEQTLLFISIMCLTSLNIIVELDELLEWIGYEKRIGSKIYGVRKTARTYESYIYVKSI